jgi:hypothetical protein
LFQFISIDKGSGIHRKDGQRDVPISEVQRNAKEDDHGNKPKEVMDEDGTIDVLSNFVNRA